MGFYFHKGGSGLQAKLSVLSYKIHVQVSSPLTVVLLLCFVAKMVINF